MSNRPAAPAHQLHTASGGAALAGALQQVHLIAESARKARPRALWVHGRRGEGLERFLAGSVERGREGRFGTSRTEEEGAKMVLTVKRVTKSPEEEETTSGVPHGHGGGWRSRALMYRRI